MALSTSFPIAPAGGTSIARQQMDQSNRFANYKLSLARRSGSLDWRLTLLNPPIESSALLLNEGSGASVRSTRWPKHCNESTLRTLRFRMSALRQAALCFEQVLRNRRSRSSKWISRLALQRFCSARARSISKPVTFPSQPVEFPTENGL